MATLQVDKAFPYAGNRMRVGDRIENADERVARVLELMGYVHRAPIDELPAVPDDGGNVGEEEVVPVVRMKKVRGKDKKPRKRRIYRRRDMIAEE